MLQKTWRRARPPLLLTPLPFRGGAGGEGLAPLPVLGERLPCPTVSNRIHATTTRSDVVLVGRIDIGQVVLEVVAGDTFEHTRHDIP